MCGITGFIGFDHGIETKFLVKMNNLIKHRGPDDEGYYVITEDGKSIILAGDDTVDYSSGVQYLPQENINDYLSDKIKFALGHRRLSIVDLSSFGHQPMNIDNNYWITYNGEIYNYIEIRQELENLGCKFISNSDTEVILMAYKIWGESCLNKFNGMFSFIIYNVIKNKVFIARDRFGIKPLYYYITDNGIFFASEIKQFTALSTWSPNLNHQKAYEFLAYGISDHTDETLFSGVYQLKGGHYCVFDLDKLQLKDKKLSVQRWYDLVRDEQVNDYEIACEKFKKLFYDSISKRLRADVAVGSCLSGGLDSSAIVSVMDKILKERNAKNTLMTFSACSKYKAFDEKEFIDEVVAHCKVKPLYTYPELDILFQENEKIAWYQDEPFGSTSIYAQWCVFKLAKSENVKVILDGQGADEQLSGYQGSSFQIYLNELLHNGKITDYFKELRLFKKYYRYQILPSIIKSLVSFFPLRVKVFLSKYFNKNYNHKWINPILNFTTTDPYIGFNKKMDDVQHISYQQIMHTNLPILLHWEDRNSMAHSIESRVPFLDYRLVELLYKIPSSAKIKHGITKAILRDSLENILPNKIKNRLSKLGFVTPEVIWIKENSELFRNRLIEAIELSQGILDSKSILSNFDDIINGKQKFNFWIWRIISFGAWMKAFQVKL